MTVMTVLSTQGFVVLSPRILTSPQFNHFLNSVLSTQYLLTVHPSVSRMFRKSRSEVLNSAEKAQKSIDW